MNYLFKAEEVAVILNVSKSTAYKKIAEWNKELRENGYFTVSGKIPKKYLMDHCYGLIDDKEVS